MKFTLKDTPASQVETACLVIGALEDTALTGAAREVDEASNGLLGRLIESGDIEADRSQTTLLHSVPGVRAERVLVVGFGEPDKFSRPRFQAACMAAGACMREHAATEAHLALHDIELPGCDAPWLLRQAAVAFDHANYLYSATKPIKDTSPKPVRTASLQGGAALQPALDQAIALCAGYRTSRELGNLPPNICNPAYLAQHSRQIAERYANTSIEVLDEDAMGKLGMDALLGVGQGSENDSRLIVLRYQGAGEEERPYVFVGKGVTFDTGGISLKPREGMDQMKYDMCGAASVIGAFEACAGLQLPLNLLAVVAAVENMPDGKAYRPGDVLTSMSGKTIEILNTDAEGRLALCDALTYCQRFEPRALIDVATLTGACVVALGHHASAIMTHDDDLASELLQAGETAVDRGWRLPIWEDYNAQLKSPFADMKNVGGMPAGAITAGCFLAKFTKGQRWAHVDVAGSAWKWDANQGATGRPVGLLTQFLMDRSA